MDAQDGDVPQVAGAVTMVLMHSPFWFWLPLAPAVTFMVKWCPGLQPRLGSVGLRHAAPVHDLVTVGLVMHCRLRAEPETLLQGPWVTLSYCFWVSHAVGESEQNAELTGGLAVQVPVTVVTAVCELWAVVMDKDLPWAQPLLRTFAVRHWEHVFTSVGLGRQTFS